MRESIRFDYAVKLVHELFGVVDVKAVEPNVSKVFPVYSSDLGIENIVERFVDLHIARPEQFPSQLINLGLLDVDRRSLLSRGSRRHRLRVG